MPLLQNIKSEFKKEEFKGLAIDIYISSLGSVERSFAEKGFIIKYKKIRDDGTETIKFATQMNINRPTLVLHIGKKEDNKGLELQMKVDEKLGRVYERNHNQSNEKTHEVFIRLDWVSDLEEIKEFIDKAYDERG